MIVNTNSWHFKLNGRWWGIWEHDSSNLCKYFWETVLSVLITALIVSVICFVIGMWGYLIWNVPFYNKIMGVIIIAWFFSIVFVPIFAIKGFRKLVGEDVAIPIPSLFAEYVKAKKNKYCPIIEFRNIDKGGSK